MRYFLEVSYMGTAYAGFQVQKNAPTIQAEVEKALLIFFRNPVALTGSSRTDAGVHAVQNFFHFDTDTFLTQKIIYNLNSLLPADIVVKSLKPVNPGAHARFSASAREYRYCIYFSKDPFIWDRAWYFPYPLNPDLLQQAATIVMNYKNFASFSKRNDQVHTHDCTIYKSEWHAEKNGFVYTVKSNRFLRGMVRGLVGTMVQVGQGKTSIEDFKNIIANGDQRKVNFSPPGRGLVLMAIDYPDTIFEQEIR